MELLQEDLQYVLRRLPKIVEDMLVESRGSLIMTGDFIRSCIVKETPSDIDIFSKTRDIAKKAAEKLETKIDKCLLTETDYTYILFGASQFPIQFIYQQKYKKPEDILPFFDFTIVKAMVWFSRNNWHSLCGERFYQDLAAKRLAYCYPEQIEEVGASLLRVLKFHHRGYRIPLDSLAGVTARLFSGIGLEKTGTEERRMGHAISKLLCKTNPLTLSM